MHPAWREFRDELCATATGVFAYLGGLAVIGVTVLLIFTPPEEESADEQPFRSDWTTVGRPIRAFALSTPEFAQPNSDYAIQRHVSGGGRRDIMNWGGGSSEGERSRLMIEIYRPGEEIGDFGDAASEVAIRTAALGGPYPLLQAPEIESKFGAFDAFDFVAMAAYHCCAIIWLAYLWIPEVSRQTLYDLPENNVEQWNAELQRLLLQ